MERYRSLNRMFTLLAALGLSAAALAAPATPAAKSKAAEYASEAFDKSAALARRAEAHGWLMSEAVRLDRLTPITANPSAAEKAAVDNAPRGISPDRVGITQALSVSVSFADLRPRQLRGRVIERSHGAMTGTQDGGYVYTSALQSDEATALRVHFTGFSLPENAGVYLFTENGQVFGPYTGRGPLGDGEFWSHTVMGERVYLQLRHAGPASDEDLRATRFNVAGLGHVRPRWLGFCSGNATCVQNAACGADPATNAAEDAVAHMQWISGPYIYICSGGLVADSDTSTSVPYFLSANHCISRGKDARNLENFFQFTKPCGTGGGCDDVIATRNNHPQSLRTLGARIVSTASATDHTLFELSEPAPAGSAFLGWNSDEIAYTDGAKLHRISHPGGAPQAYSSHDVDAFAPTCRTWPRGDRIYSRDDVGATEGGSSGSPVLNAAGQIVGQLSGACGTNLNDNCDAVNNATVDGAFAAYFSQVAPFLAGDSCSATEPAEVSCNDGADNDCDGLVDAADPDCDTTEPPGGGAPKGASCTADSDCASNKCKGPAGNMTCR